MKRILLILLFSSFVISFTKAQELPSNIPTDGLVAYYPFNGNANDASGNGNHGTVNGATLTTDKDGNGNKAYLFTVNSSSGWGASQNSITIGTPAIPNNNSFTMSAWVNLAEKPSPFDNRPHTIMGRWDGNGTAIFRHQINYNGNISTNLLEGSSPNITQGGSLSYNTWEHVLISFDGQVLKQYQNGVLVNEEILNIQLNNSNTNLTIGELHMANGHWYLFSGKIDEMGYWSRALTQQEIQSVFNSTNNSSDVEILLNGTISAENNQIKNVADPTDDQDVVTKSYLETEVNSITQQNIQEVLTNGNNANGTQLKGLADPTDAQDAVTIAYLESKLDALIDRIEQIEGNQPNRIIKLKEVKLIEKSRNLIKTSASRYIIRTEDNIYISDSINGTYENLNFNLNVSRGDIHGHLLGETLNNSILISTKDNGLFKLENEEWRSIGLNGFGTSGNDFLKLENNRILIAKEGYLRKIYYSDDNGDSWSASSGTNNEDWRDFSVTSNGSIFIGSPGNNVGGVLRSRNNGLSFDKIRSERCRTTSTRGNDVFIISWNNSENKNILMKSIDDGDSWSEIFTFDNFTSTGYAEIVFYNDTIVLLNDEKIYWSSINNIDFSEAILPSDFGSFREVSYIGDKVFAIYDKGIFEVGYSND
ncbi:LamG-like jellyroll fold domain-containing protein [Polaribacter sp.]|uniref:LamG-like jellyroll fold domain-containing protein n=1 Tax=Polaribacter sp. TaxID=1920175 RepID=UPI0025F35F48|nr:LamG-like jellyroll fold domain-containing protein [Polaribacter sp.]